jgi:hypothetical protein
MRFRLSFAIVAALLFASAAQAAQTRIAFAPNRALEAGEVVTVGWEDLPADVDELEFLLSTGDGQVVRLTPQFLPSTGSFGWTVPNLPSREAVLELRAGIRGEELVLASSEPFVIRGAARSAHVEFRDGEWWALEAGRPAPDAPALHAVTRGSATRSFVRPRQWLPRVALHLGADERVMGNEVCASRVDTRCGAPLVVPQRK